MSSPLIRRLRLGHALKELRLRDDLTSEQFGRKAGMSRIEVSRLENGERRPDLKKVLACLDAAGVPENSDEYRLYVRLARDANQRGWWDDKAYTAMGDRQRTYADIESGATALGLYHNVFIPGPLQTAGYIAAREEAVRVAGLAVDPAQRAGRQRRQEALIRPDGPSIAVVVEEQVIRRRAAPADVMADQLRHLITLTERYPQITVQVLPVDCELIGVVGPRSPFALHSFADPDDGTALMVETVTDDVLLREPVEVARYVRLFARLRDAALSEADSAAFITAHAASAANRE